MSTPEFTLLRAQELATNIHQYDPAQASALFELLKGVVDPSGDRSKYSIADEVMKQVVLFTPQFEEWFREMVA